MTFRPGRWRHSLRGRLLAVLLLAWIYSRSIVGSEALADIGALSFSALATLAPALGYAIWRPQTPPRAVLIGLLCGFAIWCWLLLVPSLVEAFAGDSGWLRGGPFGWSWLAPDAMFGLDGWSRTTRGLVLSLAVGAAMRPRRRRTLVVAVASGPGAASSAGGMLSCAPKRAAKFTKASR